MEEIRVSLGLQDLDLEGNGPDMAEITINTDTAMIEITGNGPDQPEIIIQPSGPVGPTGSITPELVALRDATAALKAAAKVSEDNAKLSETAAATSKTAAANSATAANTSKTNAATSETNALASKNAAAVSATNASGSATLADEAADDAIAALTATETARDASIQAKTDSQAARDTAVLAKTNSELARDQAVAAKENILEIRDETAASKDAAALSASEALASKNAASVSAGQSAGSAFAASISAGQAANSETAGAASAAVSVQAKEEAEQALASALLAKDSAIAARSGSETARTGAEAAQASATSARDDAVLAKDGAVAAKNAANQSAIDAAASADSIVNVQSRSEKDQPGGYAGLDVNGKLSAGQLPPLGALAAKDTVATTDIDNKSITLAKLADITGPAFLGRITQGAGPHQILTLSNAKFMLSVDQIDNTRDVDKPISSAQEAVNATKAPIESPEFTGLPKVPTAALGTSSTQAASTAFVRNEVQAVIGAAPEALNTLQEIAEKLAEEGDAVAALTSTVSNKLDKNANLSDLTDWNAAWANLGLGTAAAMAWESFSLAAHVHAPASATVNGFMTGAQFTKLGNIEAGADVTDQENVVAALQTLPAIAPVDTTVVFANDRRFSWSALKSAIRVYLESFFVKKAGDTLTGTLFFGDSALQTSGDINSVRSAAPSTGVIFLGNTGRYLFFDGTKYQMPSSPLVVPSVETTKLTVTSNANYISMEDSDAGQTRHVHHNSSLIGFLGADGGWTWRVDDNGAVWSKQFGDLNTYLEGRLTAHQNAAVNRSVTQSRMAGYVEAALTSSPAVVFTNSGYVMTMAKNTGGGAITMGARQLQNYIANTGWFMANPF